MNVDTVETVETTETSESFTQAATAEEIAANYRCEEWRTPTSGSGDNGTDAVAGCTITSFTDVQSSINDRFTISDTEINGKTRPTIQLKLQGVRPYNVFIDSKNYTKVTQEEEFSAEYATSFGTTSLTSSSGVCGEAAYWFKLGENNAKGYGIIFDNHGPNGCGFFDNDNNTVYLVKLDGGVVRAVDIEKYRAKFVDYAQYPEYRVKVTERNGKAAIEISPANATAGLVDGDHGGTDRFTEANDNVVKWEDVDVSMYDTPFTQAYGFYDFGGEYFADSSVTMEHKVTKQIVKSFGDIVYEPTWTDGALHMLINMDDEADRTMLDSDGGRESSTVTLRKQNSPNDKVKTVQLANLKRSKYVKICIYGLY